MNRKSGSVALGVFILLLAAQAVRAADSIKPDAAAPLLTFEGRVVTASNVTPGGDVVFFAVGLVPTGWQSTVMRWSQAVSDDDRDGTVTYDAGAEVPCKSIWIAAELTNGHFAVAAPPGCPLRQVALDSRSFKKSAKGELELFLHARPYLDLLYVHPGKGAWTISAADSFPTDADGESNGVTAIALSGARSLTGDGTKAKDFVPGGILIAIDLYKLDVVAERLDAKMLNEVLK